MEKGGDVDLGRVGRFDLVIGHYIPEKDLANFLQNPGRRTIEKRMSVDFF